jgi:hypothetical protein
MNRGPNRKTRVPLIVYNSQPRSGDPKQGGTGLLSSEKEIAYCLDSKPNANVIQAGNTRMRKFTEIEAERLQGLPDNWTKYGDYDNGTMCMFGDNKRIQEISTNDRFECCGNGLTTNVAKFVRENFI